MEKTLLVTDLNYLDSTLSMVMVSSETVHVRNVFSVKFVLAFFLCM